MVEAGTGSNENTGGEFSVGVGNLSKMTTAEVVTRFQINSQDTGSPEVQIALLTKRLEELSQHFKKAPKDHHSKRGMLNLISQRKQLLAYLRREDAGRYKATISALGLRK